MVVIVVALDDCTISVTNAPQNVPDKGVAAAFASVARRPEPANSFRLLVMMFMPSKKRPTPPSTAIAVDILALLFLADESRAHRSQFFPSLSVDFRVREIELFDRLNDRRGHNKP